MLVAIDPGTVTGWAAFDVGDLVGCGLDDPPRDGVTAVWIEDQYISPRSNPRSILKLGQTAGRWAGIYAALDVSARFVSPMKWKGQTPKAICHSRIWDALSAFERKLVDVAGCGMAPSKRHNMLDAIGIGLWAVGRFKR